MMMMMMMMMNIQAQIIMLYAGLEVTVKAYASGY
jgi:hypothetical protein